MSSKAYTVIFMLCLTTVHGGRGGHGHKAMKDCKENGSDATKAACPFLVKKTPQSMCSTITNAVKCAEAVKADEHCKKLGKITDFAVSCRTKFEADEQLKAACVDIDCSAKNVEDLLKNCVGKLKTSNGETKRCIGLYVDHGQMMAIMKKCHDKATDATKDACPFLKDKSLKNKCQTQKSASQCADAMKADEACSKLEGMMKKWAECREKFEKDEKLKPTCFELNCDGDDLKERMKGCAMAIKSSEDKEVKQCMMLFWGGHGHGHGRRGHKHHDKPKDD